jgi:acetylornithine deacetylase/succinyl-diaminopimelate desuccinylase-like protein
MTEIHAALDRCGEALVSEVEAIAAIPAPSFEESDRAAYVAERFRNVGLSEVTIDAADNVRGFLRGAAPHPHVMLAAHMDTVYPRDAHRPPRRSGSQLLGSSVRDNAAGVAALIALADALRTTGAPPGTLEFVATTGEEGRGDLRGIRHRLRPEEARPDAVLVVDGPLGQIVHQGIAVKRFAVRFETDGGHSWGDFGAPSAIHHIASLIHTLTRTPLSPDPKTTLNVGVIHGGTSVNAIAASAEMQVDFRSVDGRYVDRLVTRLEQLLAEAETPGVRTTLTVIGDRPGGRIAQDHPLVRAVRDAHRARGIEARLAAASTDANIPLALGIPSVSVGVSSGGQVHSPNEWLDTNSLLPGLHLLADVVASVVTGAATPR